MKIQNLFLAVAVGAIGFCSTARAQFDTYAGARTLVVDTRNLAVLALNLNSTTNAPVDIHGYDGIAKLDIFSFSNNVATTCLLALQTSPDTTNWTTMANVSYAVPTVVIFTNTFYGGVTGALATNTFDLPGTITYPSVASAGFATPYIQWSPFTNSVSALDISHNGWQTLGFNIADQQRYLRAVYTPSGTVTNFTVGIVLTAKRHILP